MPGDPEPAESDRESLNQRVLTLLGTLTGVWAVIGAISYAVLWNAYTNFYEAFGLTPAEVGMSREHMLARAGVSALIVMAVLAGPVISGALAFWLARDRTHIDAVGGAGLYVPAVCIIVLLGVMVSRLDELGAVGFFALLWTLGLCPGVILGAMSRPDSDEVLSSWLAATVVAGAIVLINLVLLAVLLATTADFTLKVLIVVTVDALIAYLVAGRRRPGWFGRFGQVEITERELLRSAVRRNRARLAFITAGTLLVGGTLGLLGALTWSGAQQAEGTKALERGYHEPRGIFAYAVRPIYVYRVDPARDPLRLCGEPRLSASLVATEGPGWWILLRPAGTSNPEWARMVWVPRDKYLIDLAPLAQPERRQPAPEPSSGSASSAPAAAFSWQTPACR